MSLIEHCPSMIEHCPSMIEHCPSMIEHCPSMIEHCLSIIEHCSSILDHCSKTCCFCFFCFCSLSPRISSDLRLMAGFLSIFRGSDPSSDSFQSSTPVFVWVWPALLSKVLILEIPLVSWRCLPLSGRGLGDLLRAWPLSFSSPRDLKPSHVKQPFANLHWPQHVSRRMAHHFQVTSFFLKVWQLKVWLLRAVY